MPTRKLTYTYSIKGVSILKRIIFSLLVLILASSFAFVKLVEAHHPAISGVVSCVENQQKVVWTIANSETISGRIMKITAINRSIGVAVNTLVNPNASVNGQEFFAGNAVGTITLTVTGKWEYANPDITDTESGSVTLGGQCIQPTSTPTKTPTPVPPTATSTPSPTLVQPSSTPTPTIVEEKPTVTPEPSRIPTVTQGPPCTGSACDEPKKPEEYKPAVCSVQLPSKPSFTYGRKDSTTVEIKWNEDNTNTTHWSVQWGYSEHDLPYGALNIELNARSFTIGGLKPNTPVWIELGRWNTPECVVYSDRIDP